MIDINLRIYSFKLSYKLLILSKVLIGKQVEVLVDSSTIGVPAVDRKLRQAHK
jgi:hypothetical protein